MENGIMLVALDSQPVLSVRRQTKLENLPQVIGQAYGLIMEHLNRIGVQPVDAPYTAYYNLDMNDLDVEMGFPVAEMQEDEGDINAGRLPACQAVTCMYQGAYADMNDIYEKIFRWMEENNCKATGVYYEYYYNSPNEVPESELLTKIVIPVI